MHRLRGRQELDMLLEQKAGQELDWRGTGSHLQRAGGAQPHVLLDRSASLYLGLSVIYRHGGLWSARQMISLYVSKFTLPHCHEGETGSGVGQEAMVQFRGR